MLVKYIFRLIVTYKYQIGHILVTVKLLFQLRVLHDYTAQRSDEIGLKAGEFVKLVYMDTDG